MGIRFRKSIKLGKYLKLNISKSGISATVGKQGASINIGGKGTYLNLSPTAAGIKGTGVSYRQKLTGGVGSLVGLVSNKITNAKEEKVEEQVNTEVVNTNNVEEYKEIVDTNVNLYKYTDDVLNKEALDKRVDDFEDSASKEVYKLAIEGNEDTIESLVGAFFNNLDLNYDVKANYELEEHNLYIDLDLPEIEDFEELNKQASLKKTKAEVKEEYGKTILSLGIYVAANMFNLTSYIDQVCLSAFTSTRDNNGDLKDTYLYSVKFNRDVFENTKLNDIEDAYKFLLQFENRINMSSTYSFKGITPFEMASVESSNKLIDEAIEGLKVLGYKVKDIETILPELKNEEFETAGEYIKKGLKLLKND